MKAKILNPLARFHHRRVVFGALVLGAILLHACGGNRDETPPALSPTITTLDPNTGLGGTEVKIGGSGFGSNITNIAVMFNGKNATVKSVSETLIVAVVPDGAGEGNVTVSVHGTTTTGPVFHYRDRLAIASAKPLQGATGTMVTLVGKGFSDKSSENLVFFNNKNAVVKSVKKDTLIAEVPFQAGDGPISVKVGAQLVSGPPFDFIDPTGLTITDVTPLTGVPGQDVVITGTEFSAIASENIVKFNGTLAVVKAASATGLIVIVPASATSGSITIEVGSQKITGPVFNIPVITSLSATSGSPGSLLYLYGSGFSPATGDNSVFFNGVLATVITASTTVLQVIVPLNASTGAVTLRIGNVVVNGPVFTVLASAITSINPERGFPEIDVTISGQSFDPLMSVVKFNGQAATIKNITPTQIIATVPISATTGPVTVESGGRVLSGPVFTVIQSAMTSISPTRGIVGQEVVITGTDFNTDLSMAILKFNGVPAEIKSISETRIVAIVPPGATTGNISLEYGRRILYGPVFIVSSVTVTTVWTSDVNTRLSNPSGLAFDGEGNLYVVDEATHVVNVVDPAGTMRRFAGTGNAGFANGPLASATFFSPITMVFGTRGERYVTDAHNNAIRVIENETVSTLAGGSVGKNDGSGSHAQFNAPATLTYSADGNIYVTDFLNGLIRKVTPSGEVTTFMGSNGSGVVLQSPYGIASDAAGNLYVGDNAQNRIVKITPAGIATALASVPGPLSLAVSRSGYVYVISDDSKVYAISPNGTRTIVTDVFYNPIGLTLDANDDLYVSDAGTSTIHKIMIR
ncbi:IPT/TIG domain-containing protein [Chryseolinea lacunae]|uniref:IPT/TIG domain-containing protein n=1 Tax=Chryseolinea lacunae TaxID=2801331 RepID=A0ABS1KN01_9BACT|nr:IPT/TIG domain-containing protein [Chryseolinea lacunae]MBL0740834.1 IPT/TIG domain-containing protein [Chryseolinea lacunae]